MENQVIDISKKLKRKERKDKIMKWWEENKKYVAVVLPIVGAITIKGIGAITKSYKLRTEFKMKDLRCYDASLGHYWELKRKLTNSDWLYINRRKAHGESLGNILRDMNALR